MASLGQSAQQASSRAGSSDISEAARHSLPSTLYSKHAAFRRSAVSGPSKCHNNPAQTVHLVSTWICRHYRCLQLSECRRAAPWLYSQARQAGPRARVDRIASPTRQDWRRIPAYCPRGCEQCLFHRLQDQPTRCHRSATYPRTHHIMW
jgi:hypothetical protein